MHAPVSAIVPAAQPADPEPIPVARLLLSGGPEQLRVPAAGLAWLAIGCAASVALRTALAALGLGATLGGAADGGSGFWVTPVAVALELAVLTAATLTIAAGSARWLGRRTGLLAGWVFLTAAHHLLPPVGLADAIESLCGLAALGAFAAANAPGRIPLSPVRPTRLLFFAALAAAAAVGGLALAVAVLLPALLFAVVGGDNRALRFFAMPAGWAMCAAALAARLFLANDALAALLPDWAHSMPAAPGAGLLALAVAGLPWTPLALAALAVGLRQGHYATAFWRLCGCGLVGPLALSAAELVSPATAAAIVLPPLAIMAAAALAEMLRRCRRRRARPDDTIGVAYRRVRRMDRPPRHPARNRSESLPAAVPGKSP